MTDQTMSHQTDTTPTRADRTRQSAIAISAVLAVVGATIGSGAFSGTPIAQAAGGALSAEATVVAPGGSAFGIWSVIYLGLIGMAIWQLLPQQSTDPRLRRLGWWICASMLLNAVWIISIQANQLWLSVPVIALLLITLIVIFRAGRKYGAKNWIEATLMDGTFGLYLGWVSVATIANVAAVLKDAGVGDLVLGETIWGIVVLVIAAGIGVAVAVAGHGRLAVAAALAWGLSWIAIARLQGPLLSGPVAITAILAAVVTVAAAVVMRFRSHNLKR